MNWDYLLIGLGLVLLYYVYDTIMKRYGENRRFRHLDTRKPK